MSEIYTIDFETESIEARPKYPPKPVGVAVKKGRGKAKYYAWGHPAGNNTDKETATQVLADIWKSGAVLLFHNAKFDLDVAESHLGLPLPAWHRVHDTLFQLFLDDPHAASLSLKPAAERLLGLPPAERDAVRDWLVDQRIVRKEAKGWGAHIAKAPGDLVGKYAVGDVDRTYQLYQLLKDRVSDQGEAYERERRLLPYLLDNERRGIRVDGDRMRQDFQGYVAAQQVVDKWLRRRLKAPGLNLDSDRELADTLDRNGVVKDWVITPSGQRSVAKDNLTLDKFLDKKVAQAIGYRSKLGTCLSTFYKPWLEMAEANNGFIYTNWNQVRQSHGDESMSGTRTGRLSCSPNFQNIPKSWDDKDDGYSHPGHIECPTLPLMRRYVLPDKGCSFGHRDYSQQELRILAHFEDDKLCLAYKESPRLDVHTFSQQQIKAIAGLEFERRSVKILTFGIIYGMGLGRLSLGLRTDVDTARRLRDALRTAIPGLGALEKSVKHRGAAGEFVRTWGGRKYYAEPPKIIAGRMCSFEYKLLNYLIQGSASDCTKEAIIRYHEMKKDGRFLVTVHDEINISAPKKAMKGEIEVLREAMEGVKFDVPMLSDFKVGPNWGELE